MIFDLEHPRVRLHPIHQTAPGMAWEASTAVFRMAGPEYLITPGKPQGGLAGTVAAWLSDAGPEVAIQVVMGSLWAPDWLGVQLNLAVLGPSLESAQTSLRERAHELAMWLQIYDSPETWMPCDVDAEKPWMVTPIRFGAPQVRRHCPVCSVEDDSAERFLEVARRTRTGLIWTLRSRPGGEELESEAMMVRRRLMTLRRRTRVPQEYEHCESLMSRLDDVEFDPLAMPYELAMGLVGAKEVRSVVRFAGLEAALEWTNRDTDPLPVRVSTPGLGIHASMDFLGVGQPAGIDLPACRNLLRWVPGITEHTEEAVARQKQSNNRTFDPRVLFEAS